MVENFNILVEQSNCTVMTRYEAAPREATAYQSEARLEADLIAQLVAQGYERLEVTDEAGLIANLRRQMERLNDIRLSDGEWDRLLRHELANENLNIEDKTERLQRDPMVSITLDNGESKNILLINKRDIYANHLQVMNQYTPTGGTARNRYDVTLLVNGLPMVHIELKRRGVNLKEAFNQINRYGRESFWADNGLFDYVQLFVISNGTQTKYYSNTTRYAHCQEAARQKLRVKTQSHSFEFTSFWADARNRIITDLTDFAATFLTRRTLLEVLTRYCVFTVDKNLMVMRPYQIAATERILLKIRYAQNRRLYGTRRAGGYIWHTTGSGKTLTSFKTAQLASQMPGIDKVLFVVDRKDLDYQTMKEYDNFEKDSANSNSSAAVLLRQLNNPDCRIIITTIQKLSTLLRQREPVRCLEQHVVMIFDECHRSQFGEQQRLISKHFKKYYLFGFTGTPIFAVNAVRSSKGDMRTTSDIFGGEPDAAGKPTQPLHCYTIIDAINDHNVLKFKIDYLNTMRLREGMDNQQVWAINGEKLLKDPRYISNNVTYILDNFARKTKRNESYTIGVTLNVSEMARRRSQAAEKRGKSSVSGFNSLLAVDSTEKARLYYEEFVRQQALRPEAERLRVATIFTYAQNEEENESTGAMEDENPEAIDRLDVTSKEFLAHAIGDYNRTFGTNYGVDADRFAAYYKDVSLRMKNREIDLLIVVGMFLTGFDAKTLNTLWVDKNLRMQGLLQAFSRTNRILNSVKDCGNIVCFRNLEEEVNQSLALFGDRDANGIIRMRSFADYYEGYDEQLQDGTVEHHAGYREVEQWLLQRFALGTLAEPHTDEEKREFVRLFGALLKLRNLLSAFDEFDLKGGRVLDDEGHDTGQRLLINEAQLQDYTSWYISLRDEFRIRSGGGEREDVNNDVVFEIELVRQVQVNIDFILLLVAQYHDSHSEDKELVVKIRRAIDSNPELRDKRTLIEQFIERTTNQPSDDDIYQQWERYVNEQREADLQTIIESERLKPAETRAFMQTAFAEGGVPTAGIGIARILPPMPLFGGGGKRAEKKNIVLERLKAFFEKYCNV